MSTHSSRSDWVGVAHRYGVVAIAVLAVHGWILAMDGVYWDGVLISRLEGEHDWESLRGIFSDVGLPLFYYLHRVLGAVPGMCGYRVAAVASFLVLGWCLLALLDAFFTAGRPAERVLLAVAGVLYPAYRVGFELIVVPYDVLYAAFAVGCVLLERGTRAPFARPRRAKVQRWLALACFAFSFSLNSLLVVYGVIVALVAARARRVEGRSWRSFFPGFIRAHLAFVLLPLLFVALSRALFPVHGTDASYNQIRFSLGGAVHAGAGGIFHLLAGQLAACAHRAWTWPLAAAALAAMAYLVSRRQSLAGSGVTPTFLAVLAMWLITAEVPYALVGKAAAVEGWASRHALVGCAPAAMLVVGGVLFALRAHPRSALALACWLVGLFGLVVFEGYARWQVRWADDRSIVLQLAKAPEPPAGTFRVHRHSESAGEAHYRFYEWADMFRRAWGTKSHVGFEEDATPSSIDEAAKLAHVRSYGVSPDAFSACVGTVTVAVGLSSASALRVALDYERRRFGTPAERDCWLETLTSVTLAREGCSTETP